MYTFPCISFRIWVGDGIFIRNISSADTLTLIGMTLQSWCTAWWSWYFANNISSRIRVLAVKMNSTSYFTFFWDQVNSCLFSELTRTQKEYRSRRSTAHCSYIGRGVFRIWDYGPILYYAFPAKIYHRLDFQSLDCLTEVWAIIIMTHDRDDDDVWLSYEQWRLHLEVWKTRRTYRVAIGTLLKNTDRLCNSKSLHNVVHIIWLLYDLVLRICNADI